MVAAFSINRHSHMRVRSKKSESCRRNAVADGSGLNAIPLVFQQLRILKPIIKFNGRPYWALLCCSVHLLQGLRKTFDPGYRNEWTFGP